VRVCLSGTEPLMGALSIPWIIYGLIWSSGGKILTGKTEGLGEKPVLVPVCPLQIPHGLTWAGTRASAARSRWLTAWAKAQPLRRMERTCEYSTKSEVPTIQNKVLLPSVTDYSKVAQYHRNLGILCFPTNAGRGGNSFKWIGARYCDMCRRERTAVMLGNAEAVKRRNNGE
jgi:hypothetical protein